ncbi:unnamed protein product [Protopolystoma xenopodis]|uniref:Uncharacterized protein n=1 Tax=Protopolystoma xenopodis TaxID=117903 RepID=A0A448WZD4_9PLAT|nr:unnamed protein product [Protopolystoma xenopodis]
MITFVFSSRLRTCSVGSSSPSDSLHPFCCLPSLISAYRFDNHTSGPASKRASLAHHNTHSGMLAAQQPTMESVLAGRPHST